jgi:DNA anti-recombination protein RmuC
MRFEARKYGLLAALVMVMAFIAGCAQSDLEQAVEATVEVQQENIDTAFTAMETLVTEAAQLAGGLPSQEAKAELIVEDLAEINTRLTDAVAQEAEEKVAALEDVAAALATVQSTVEEAKSEMADEAQADLEELQSKLEDAAQAIQDEIASVNEELGQTVEADATEVADTVEEAEGEAESEEATPTPSD